MATENTGLDISFDEYLTACRENHVTHPDWRWGQTLFNVLHVARPDLSSKVRGTLMDPFYSEGSGSKVNKFLTFVAENW